MGGPLCQTGGPGAWFSPRLVAPDDGFSASGQTDRTGSLGVGSMGQSSLTSTTHLRGAGGPPEGPVPSGWVVSLLGSMLFPGSPVSSPFPVVSVPPETPDFLGEQLPRTFLRLWGGGLQVPSQDKLMMWLYLCETASVCLYPCLYCHLCMSPLLHASELSVPPPPKKKNSSSLPLFGS